MPSAITASATLSARPPLNTIGLPVMTPCSLPAAISDPVNVTEPMITSSTVNTDVVPSTPPGSDSSWMYS